MKSFCIHLLVLILLTSCNHVYKEYDKDSFPTYTWNDGQEVVFNPMLEDVTKKYQLTLGLRHVYGLQVESISLNVRMISPSGKELSKDYELRIMKSGQYVGSCGGDLCDLETAVDELQFEEAGEYQFIVTHNISGGKIPGVMEFGIILDMMD